MKLTILLIAVSFLSACTNSLYLGRTSYQDDGKDRKAIVFWNDTTHVLNSDGKPSPVTLLDGCSDYRIQFSEQNDGTLMFVESSSDFSRINGMGREIDASTIECGEFLGKKEVSNGNTLKTKALLYCNKITSPLKPGKSIPARKDPYVFDMEVESEFSWFGGEIEPPQKPECN